MAGRAHARLREGLRGQPSARTRTDPAGPQSPRVAPLSVEALLEMELHHPPDLELYGALWGHLDALERLGVLGGAGGPFLGLENAEVAELQTVSVAQLLDHVVQKTLDDLLDDHAFGAGLIGNPVHQFLFGHRSHGGPFRNNSTLTNVTIPEAQT